LLVFDVLCAESLIAESLEAESGFILRESDILMVSIGTADFFAGFVSAPYPSESDRTPALVALSLLARFDEQAAIAAATGTAAMSFDHFIVVPS